MMNDARIGVKEYDPKGIIPDRDAVFTAKIPRKRKTQRLSRTLLTRTLVLLAVCGIAAFVVLATRLYEIQIVNGGYFEARTLSGQLRETSLNAMRGTIYDSDGRILAMSGPVENVFISPLEMYLQEQDVRFIAEGLSRYLDVDVNVIIERAGRTSSQYQIIKRNVTADEAADVRAFISEYRLRGVHFEESAQRFYPNNTLASHVLGFVGGENTGLDGLEQRLEDQLSGVSGRMIRLTNARGANLMLYGFNDYFDAQDGNNVNLTLNLSVQYYLEKHLEQAITDFDVRGSGIAIAMDPRTGGILGIANYPNFDPNNFLTLSDSMMETLSLIEDEDEFVEAYRAAQFSQWRNNALADTYEPGSVFKVLTWAMALEENIASLDSYFHCRGYVNVRLFDGVAVRNCHRRFGHGDIGITEAMARSCNAVCVMLAIGVGARTFYDYIDAFGLFDRTGLDNSVEGRSIWWDDRTFTDPNNHTQLASASFGQTFRITPIQMITAISATINGGYLMQPYIVSSITDSNGNIVEIHEPTVRRQVISNETSAIIRYMLEETVLSGTGRNAQVMGYRIGGKTGTSENVEQLARYGEGGVFEQEYIVSFVGFAPAYDPEIVILVLLNDPAHNTGIAISGGSMAAPVVGRMLADILPLSLGILPYFSEDEIPYINLHVPRLTGHNVEYAIQTLTRSGFNYEVIGSGDLVTAQLPARNAFISSGSTVIIYAGGEVSRDPVEVPNLTGLTYRQAKTALENQGLFIRTVGASRSDPNAFVSLQSIPSGREALPGATIEVTLINTRDTE